MISLGKYQLLEPMCIFSITTDEVMMRNMIEILKDGFANCIIKEKISKKQYDNYIKGFSYIPFFTLAGFERYVNEYKRWNVTGIEFEKYVYALLVMDDFLTGSAIKMNKTGLNDGELKMVPINDFQLLSGLKILVNVQKPIYLNIKDVSDVGSISKVNSKDKFMNEFTNNYENIALLLEKYSPNQLTVIEAVKDVNMPLLIQSTLIAAWDNMPVEEVNLFNNPVGYNEIINLLTEYDLCEGIDTENI